MESCTTGRIIGVVEVKREDFLQGIAQASVQIESSLVPTKARLVSNSFLSLLTSSLF
jgi:hypothetical protein